MAGPRVPLFKGVQDISTTVYVGVPIVQNKIGAYIAWLDATSAATVTLELTSFNSDDAPVATAGTYQWKDSGLTITGPAGSAAGATLLDVDNVNQMRARLKLVSTAACLWEIYSGMIGVA